MANKFAQLFFASLRKPGDGGHWKSVVEGGRTNWL
jgi:hypothetical protein